MSTESLPDSPVSVVNCGGGGEELSEIVELPSLDTSFDSLGLGGEIVYVDSVEEWLYPPPWLGGATDDGGGGPGIISSSFESSLWDY
nr:dehydration-responsive element-binding protein 3-like [Ipomoea batatas]